MQLFTVPSSHYVQATSQTSHVLSKAETVLSLAHFPNPHYVLFIHVSFNK